MTTLKKMLYAMIMLTLMAAPVAAQPLGNDGFRPGPPPADGGATDRGMKMKHGPRGPLGQLVRFLHQNMTAAVLADLTGVSEDVIAAELEFSHPSEILYGYGVDMETFVAAMDERIITLVESAVSAECITEEQGQEIITSIEEKPERPFSMENRDVPPRFEFDD